MIYPSLTQAKEILEREDCRRIPIKMELYADTITPVTVLRRLKQVSHHCFLLESAEQSKRWGRYTFLGYDPTLDFVCQNGEVKIMSIRTIRES